MKLITASQRRKVKVMGIKEKQITIKTLAKRFIKEEIMPAIMQAEGDSINEKLPDRAWRGECYKRTGNGYKDFIDACKAILEPLGYKVEESHDGDRMYTTLAVEWKK